MESKPKIITVNVKETGLEVFECDNTPYSAPVNRTGFYNMTPAYWIKNEFPVWAETAHIKLYVSEDDQNGVQLS